jgi:hypothetical protein
LKTKAANCKKFGKIPNDNQRFTTANSKFEASLEVLSKEKLFVKRRIASFGKVPSEKDAPARQDAGYSASRLRTR